MTAGAQLKSPDQFLGYQLGTRYTPHYRIVQYFQYVAQAKPDMVKLQQYGETNEHRPLYVAFVASTENMANLEQIRKNNLALAHQGEGQPSADAPAVVWLSYNVHGNETSSSEAAMKTLFFLTDPANAESKQWLKNTVVVIDPCLNPDGRDRYVNWYNTMIGKHWNPLTIAREHREEWPGG
ncbi:MAG: zinc carboxypeptidase, partial [Chitinophagaceae bacterium]|nr:zinc carboxypeptidase [Chitinophagaceae bacterium]